MTKSDKKCCIPFLKRKWCLALIALFAVAFIAFAIYVSLYYRADDTALMYMSSDDSVDVINTSYGWLFNGPSDDSALIFYPGAKVEETAYAPILHSLASQGIDVCLISMPFRMAVLDINSADKVFNSHNYTSWYIGGHSMGGAMASIYAAAHSDKIKGLILLAAYSTVEIPDTVSELLIVGSEDHIINWNKIIAGRDLAPENYHEFLIEGGNHAQFGSYGSQKGDGIAMISSEQQTEETSRIISEYLDLLD